jgi:hypothetical protein
MANVEIIRKLMEVETVCAMKAMEENREIFQQYVNSAIHRELHAKWEASQIILTVQHDNRSIPLILMENISFAPKNVHMVLMIAAK